MNLYSTSVVIFPSGGSITDSISNYGNCEGLKRFTRDGLKYVPAGGVALVYDRRSVTQDALRKAISELESLVK